MERLRLKLGMVLAMSVILTSCGGTHEDPAPLGAPVINDGIGPQSVNLPDSDISVQVKQWQGIEVTITKGYTLTLTVDAIGSTVLQYSWRNAKTGIINGSNTSSLVIKNIQESHSGFYTVTVSNLTSALVISANVKVNVVPHLDSAKPSGVEL